MDYNNCKERFILTQERYLIILQKEYYVVVAKDGFRVGEVFDRESLFRITNPPRKKLSKKAIIPFVLEQLQLFKDEPLTNCECNEARDNESKNRFADYLIEGLQNLLPKTKK